MMPKERKDHNLHLALELAQQGWPVFALANGKVPFKGTHGHLDATTDPLAVAAAMRRPGAIPAVALTDGLVVVDVDPRNGGTLESVGLKESEADVRTPGGGWHFYFEADGLRLRNGVLPGIDLKAKGGYVVAPGTILPNGKAYDGRAKPKPMPARTREILDEALARRAERVTAGDLDEMGTRDEILAWLGRFARVERQDQPTYLALLTAAQASGRIVDLDPAKPWRAVDLETLAREASKWDPSEDARIEAIGRRMYEGYLSWKERRAQRLANEMSLVTIDARALLAKEFRPLVEPVPGLLIEGLGMLIGGPKKGKSWLAYQFAVAVATGREVLGRRALKGDVLYLALEDGERRAQGRIQTVLRHMGSTWPRGASTLDVAFNSERGDVLVGQVEDWLAKFPEARLVIVDTLQKIRPSSSGKRNQYELDVEDLGRVLAISQRHPGLAILLVHHDRKQEAADFLDAASGTHGITGSVDTALVLKRERLESQGTLAVTGRDVREDLLHLAYDDQDPFWTIDPAGGLTEEQREVWAWLRDNGPAGPTAIGEAMGMAAPNVHKMLQKMLAQRMVVVERGQYRLPFTPKGRDNGDKTDSTDSVDNEDNEG
jgi:hypothetical protein